EHRPRRAPRLCALRPGAPGASGGGSRRRAPPGVRAGRRAVRRADRRRRGAVRGGADRPPLLGPWDEADLLDVPPRPLARGAWSSPVPQEIAAAVAPRATRLSRSRRPEARADGPVVRPDPRQAPVSA